MRRAHDLRLAGLFALLIGTGIAGCGGGGGGGPVATNPPPAPPAPGPAPPPSPPPAGQLGGTVTVGNGNQTFNPTVITIPRGTRVDWDWNDSAQHTTTSDTGLWNSGFQFGPNATFSHRFDDAGTFLYHCQLHGGPGGLDMSGRVVVTP